jgi:predicted glycosyltransferase
VLLVDHMPHGAMGELVPALTELVDRGQTKVALGLRDVLDSPKVICERWRIEGAYEAITRFYDMVLVYGTQSVFDHADNYRLPAEVAAKFRYCGFVCAPQRARYARNLRYEYKGRRNPDAKLVVGMAGGGADGYPMMRALLDAVPLLQAAGIRLTLVMLTGPFMPDEQRRDLQTRAVGLPVRVRKSVSDSFSYVSAADAVVAMAGYNSTMEILGSGTPAVLVPRVGPSAEQGIRTRLMKSRGWVDGIEPRELSSATLAESILAALQRSKSESNQEPPDLNGLATAVEQLASLLPPAARGPSLASTAI